MLIKQQIYLAILLLEKLMARAHSEEELLLYLVRVLFLLELELVQQLPVKEAMLTMVFQF